MLMKKWLTSEGFRVAKLVKLDQYLHALHLGIVFLSKSFCSAKSPNPNGLFVLSIQKKEFFLKTAMLFSKLHRSGTNFPSPLDPKISNPGLHRWLLDPPLDDLPRLGREQRGRRPVDLEDVDDFFNGFDFHLEFFCWSMVHVLINFQVSSNLCSFFFWPFVWSKNGTTWLPLFLEGTPGGPTLRAVREPLVPRVLRSPRGGPVVLFFFLKV